MRFEGVFDVRAPIDRVFARVTDPNQVLQCLPDLQSKKIRSVDDFDAVVRIGVSFIRGDFQVRFKVIDKELNSHVKILGQGKGLGSTVDMEIDVEMAAREGGRTSMKWSVDAKVGGKIASMGQRLLDSQAERIINQLFDCLRAELEQG